MTSKQRTPKDLLADHELIGFARRAKPMSSRSASRSFGFRSFRGIVFPFIGTLGTRTIIPLERGPTKQQTACVYADRNR